MKISTSFERGAGGESFARARVEWEDGGTPPRSVYFSSTTPFGEPDAAAEAFLTACFVPAMRHAERRVAVDGPVCPTLTEGLRTAAAMFRNWEPRLPAAPAIEARRAVSPPAPSGRAAIFFTGGIDSLYLLRQNRRTAPRDHPAFFRDALWVGGLDFSGSLPDGDAARTRPPFDPGLAELCAGEGAEPIAISTDLLGLDPDLAALGRYWVGSALAAAAHLFRGRVESASLASGWDLRRLMPWGTHPFVDRHYGSASLAVRHENAGVSRFEKLRFLAEEWPEALRRAVVCNYRPGGRPNCGRCYKCVETGTALAAIGFAGESFPAGTPLPESIAALSIAPPYVDYWESLIPLLRSRGLSALAEAAHASVARSRRNESWAAGRGWKGRFRRWDRRLFAGAGSRGYAALRGRKTLDGG